MIARRVEADAGGPCGEGSQPRLQQPRREGEGSGQVAPPAAAGARGRLAAAAISKRVSAALESRSALPKALRQ